ncbi:MAG TPA: hypothetical protein VM938_03845 [Acidimicrobiales bacterium]|nr:hypothetical protein [Acidimicrobiales bacterium]
MVLVHASSLSFSALAQVLAAEVRRHGLVLPSFSSPPRVAGARRTIRRLQGGGLMVSVQVRGRSIDDVLGDMVDGVVVANGLRGREAEGWRLALRAAVVPEAMAA